jgi:hypothetical protein
MESCLENVKAKPENKKASLEETEAVVDVFKENLNKMDTMDSEEMETIVEWQEVCNEEMSGHYWGSGRFIWGLTFGCTVLLTAKETDPRHW